VCICGRIPDCPRTFGRTLPFREGSGNSGWNDGNNSREIIHDRFRNKDLCARRIRAASKDLFVSRAVQYNNGRRNEKFLRSRGADAETRSGVTQIPAQARCMNFQGGLQSDQRQSDGIFDKAIFWFVHSTTTMTAARVSGVPITGATRGFYLSIEKLIILHREKPTSRKPRNFHARTVWLRASLAGAFSYVSSFSRYSMTGLRL